MKPCGKWLCQAPGSLSLDGDSHEAWSTSSTEAGIKDVPGNSVLSLSLSNAFWSFIDSEWIPSDQSRWARFIPPIFGQGLKRMMMRDSNIWDRCHQPMYTFYFLSLCTLPTVEAMATTKVVVPNGPDTKNGNTFLYVNIPLLVVATGIVCFRVWWRCFKNGYGALNKADICVVICLVSLNCKSYLSHC